MATRRNAAAGGDQSPPEPTNTYLVTSPLLHNAAQDRYEIGSEIELTDAQAAPLLGRAIEPKPAKAG